MSTTEGASYQAQILHARMVDLHARVQWTQPQWIEAAGEEEPPSMDETGGEGDGEATREDHPAPGMACAALASAQVPASLSTHTRHPI